jgi:hypothetical protein
MGNGVCLGPLRCDEAVFGVVVSRNKVGIDVLGVGTGDVFGGDLTAGLINDRPKCRVASPPMSRLFPAAGGSPVTP